LKWVPLLILVGRQLAACWCLLVAFVYLIVCTREVFHPEQGSVALEQQQPADAQPTRQSGRRGLSRMVQFGVRAAWISALQTLDGQRDAYHELPHRLLTEVFGTSVNTKRNKVTSINAFFFQTAFAFLRS